MSLSAEHNIKASLGEGFRIDRFVLDRYSPGVVSYPLMEPLSTQIRNLIRAEMEIRGLSIKDLAKILGCTKENVDQILRIGEREGKGMKTVIADRIFEALGLEVVVKIWERK